MIVGLVVLPALAGCLAFLVRSRLLREALLVGTALFHAAGVAAVAWRRPAHAFGGALGVDALGLLFLAIVSALFLAVAVYAVGYLRREPERRRHDLEEDFLFSNEPDSVFVACLLLFLASMSLVTLSRHLGLLWVAVEATTLASAPLIYFHRQHRSLEAAWKYLLICSVGIGFALLGNLALAVAATPAAGGPASMLLDDLLRPAAGLRHGWLEGAFLLLLVGYGTKMGLAPMHSWLPDAHSEAPSLVSALLSGALLNCAFLGILRGQQVLVAHGAVDFASVPLQALGLFSMAIAAFFVIRQPDYKRLLAFSSVEHMGVLALGVGLGAQATEGALLHALNHSLAKAMLFLLAGNLLSGYLSKQVSAVSGALQVRPISAALWLAGFLAIAGAPPFGLFLSEFMVLRGALAGGHIVVAVLYLLLLGVVFAAMAGTVLPMVLGPAPAATGRAREPWSAVLPPVLLGAAVLALGVQVPPALVRLLAEAARLVGGA
jgi:hydrogenase-4 component F